MKVLSTLFSEQLERTASFSVVLSVCVCVCVGVDKCGRTVMVIVGRNIPVTMIDIEKVTHTHTHTH